MKNLDKILEQGEFKQTRRVNSKRKGASFERKIAKLFNKRFNTNEFNRTPGSGAYGSTHKLPPHLIVHGDLITPQNFKYTIECKNGYDLQITDLLKPKSDFFKFIEQAKSDAKKAGGLEWLVIYKKNRQPELIVTGKKIENLNCFISVNDSYFIYHFKDVLALPNDFWFKS